MLEAAFWGIIAASSLLLGAAIALLLHPRPRYVGLVMAFGAGTLMAAVAYDLVGKSIELGDTEGLVLSLTVGALVFMAGDWYISARGAQSRKGVHEAKLDEDEDESGIAIVLGTVLDGVPESFVMGLALIVGGDAAAGLVAAVFISNVPEAIGATAALLRNGWSRASIVVMWAAIAAVTGLSSLLGYAFFQSASALTGHRVEAFAAGAIIAMLATTMIPEASRAGGRLVGVAMTLGFAAGIALTGG